MTAHGPNLAGLWPVFISKVVSEHSHACSLTCCLCTVTTELRSWAETMWPAKPKILTIWPIDWLTQNPKYQILGISPSLNVEYKWQRLGLSSAFSALKVQENWRPPFMSGRLCYRSHGGTQAAGASRGHLCLWILSSVSYHHYVWHCLRLCHTSLGIQLQFLVPLSPVSSTRCWYWQTLSPLSLGEQLSTHISWDIYIYTPCVM